MQTLEPLSKAIDEAIREEPSLKEGAATDDLLATFTRLEGEVAVMASHGAEIEALLAKLLASGAHLEPRPMGQPDKGGTWELELTAGLVTAGRYVPPPA